MHYALKTKNIMVDLYKNQPDFFLTFRLATKMNQIGSFTVDDLKNCGIITTCF